MPLLRLNKVSLAYGHRALLDEVDLVSTVSGGSFTGAYFGRDVEWRKKLVEGYVDLGHQIGLERGSQR